MSASLPSVNFSIGDDVVGNPITIPSSAVTWMPHPGGFDALYRVNGPVGRFLKDRTEEMLSIAQQLAPIDTGDLVDSLTIYYGKWELGIFGEVNTAIEYALFQEYGTVNHDAHPFLRPALEAVMGPYIEGGLDLPEAADAWSGEAGMLGEFNWDSVEREWT